MIYLIGFWTVAGALMLLVGMTDTSKDTTYSEVLTMNGSVMVVTGILMAGVA